MKFSEKKVATFDKKKRIKTAIEFAKLIENNWDDLSLRLEYFYNFIEYIGFIGIYDEELFSQLQVFFNLRINRINLEDFLKISIPFQNQFITPKDFDMLKNDVKILKNDGNIKSKKLPISLILNNLRSAFNVGSIIRTSECIGVTKIFFSGYTPLPTDEKVIKTAMGTQEYIEWEYKEDVIKIFEFFKSKRIPILALETVENAPYIYERKFQFPLAILLGNEALGISESELKMVDDIVRIPVNGWKNSLNVGVSFAVFGFELVRQFDFR